MRGIVAGKLINGSALCLIVFCQSKQPETIHRGYIFNENEKLFIVAKIGPDSIDASGQKGNYVEMKNSENQHYGCFDANHSFKVGDSVIVGHNAEGEYMLSRDPSGGNFSKKK